MRIGIYKAIKNQVVSFFTDAYVLFIDSSNYDKLSKKDGSGNTVPYVEGIKRGVFASLDSPNTTTITTGGTYQYLEGTITNSPIEGFTTTATPSIKCTCTEGIMYEIDWHASVSIDSNGKTCHIAISKKPSGGSFSVIANSTMGTYLKIANEVQAFSGTTVVELAQNDEIQIVITSTSDGDVVNVEHLTTTISEFFKI